MDKMKMDVLGKNVTLYKRPESDSIYFYFYHEGKIVKGSTGCKSFQDVKSVDLGKKIYRVMEGKPAKEVVKKTYTLDMAFKDFMEWKKNQSLSARTLYDMDRKGKFLLEFYGKKDVKTLGTSQMYLKYFTWKLAYYEKNPAKRTITYTRANGKVVKGRTMLENGKIAIDDEINLLVMVLHWCQKFGHIPRELFIDAHDQNKKEGEPTMVLSKADYLKITDHMRQDNPFYCNIVRFVNNTGIRYPGELLPIQWKHIDFDKHTISIEARKRGNTKNRGHVDTLMPMTNRVKSILIELKTRKGVSVKQEDFVFVNDEGEQVKNITKYWKRTLRICEVDTRYTLYSLRHLFATRMIRRADISLKMISEIMGHTTTAMLQKHYAKWISIDSKVKTILQSEQTREDFVREEMRKKMNTGNGNGNGEE